MNIFFPSGKEDMGILKNSDYCCFHKKLEFPNFLPFLIQENGNSKFFCQFLEFPIFQDKIQAWECQ